MSRANRALLVLLVAALGLWGCARGPAGGPASAERIRTLEGKCAKLEDDYRAVAGARDQLRKKLASVEEERAKVRGELDQHQSVVKERDDLRRQVGTRTMERDAMQGQLDQLRKGIRSLLGQAEAGAQPVTSAAEEEAGTKS